MHSKVRARTTTDRHTDATQRITTPHSQVTAPASHSLPLHPVVIYVVIIYSFYSFLARDVSLERIVALLPWCPSVCPSVCLGRACIVINTAHVSADLSLWLDSPMFWVSWHQSMSTYSQPSFSSSTWKISRVWMCKLDMISQERLKTEAKLLLSANRKSYMSRRLAQQR